MNCQAVVPRFTELFIKSSRWIHDALRCLARLFATEGERVVNLFLLDTLHRKLPPPPLYTYARLGVWNGTFVPG